MPNERDINSFALMFSPAPLSPPAAQSLVDLCCAATGGRLAAIEGGCSLTCEIIEAKLWF